MPNTPSTSSMPSEGAQPEPDAGSPQANPQPDPQVRTDVPSQASEPGKSGSESANGSARPDNELLGRVVQGAHQAIDRMAEGAAPHVQRLQQGMASAGEALQDRAGQAREVGDEWAESVRCTVRENPLAALAVAMAAGLLVARLTQR
jgi:ElaB/YqjD/DUF883 family membrane-anchored ribosome-binding protein